MKETIENVKRKSAAGKATYLLERALEGDYDFFAYFHILDDNRLHDIDDGAGWIPIYDDAELESIRECIERARKTADKSVSDN
jgi:hypothetical protein